MSDFSLIFVAIQEHKAMCDATSDEEARSVLYILHFSEPCPQCTLAQIGNGVFPFFPDANWQ